jgi:hypothetical protein
VNLLLHGISAPETPSLITVDDSLRSAPSDHYDMVPTNPPFGRKSSYKVINAQGETESALRRTLFSDMPWMPGSGAEQGKCLGDVGVVAGGQVLCGAGEVIVGGDPDPVDELVVGAEVVRGREAERAAVVERPR